MKKYLILVAVALSLVSVWPLTHSGLFDVHDPTSVIRFDALRHTLNEGQIPAAWNNFLNYSHGYPLFLYYAPVFTYLGTLVSYVTPSYIVALKIAIGFMVALSSMGMYLLMQRYGRGAAAVSAVAYAYLPYHASTLYVRGAYGEGMVWALLPFVLHAWQTPIKTKRSVIKATVLTALFLLSHNSVPFLFLPALGIWVLLHQGGNWRKTVTSAVLTLGLIAWFIIPVIGERHLVQVESQAAKTVLHDHFLDIGQLWHSPWGYGGSAALDEVDGMSFMLGKFQIVVALCALGGIALKRRWDKRIVFFLSVAVIYSISATSLTSQVWGLFPTLSIVQFPWRTIGLAGVGLAALTGYAITFLRPAFVRQVSVLIVVVLVMFFNLKFFRPQAYQAYRDENFISSERYATIAQNKIPEYLPATMPTFPTTLPTDGLERTATSVKGEVNMKNTEQLMIETAFMPQWQLEVEGRRSLIEPTKEGYIQTTNDVHSGKSNVLLTWHRTNLEKASYLITLVTLLLMIVLPL